MDHQKTGALIAARRSELGLTQKELAKQLHISDRTVSKWERGTGFPDISLLEPLADALGLTLLELFHGEREPEAAIPPERERTARETLRSLKTEITKTAQNLRRWRRWLLCAVAVLLVLLIPSRGEICFGRSITAAQATKICPFILITTQEYDLIQQILDDPDIAPLMQEGALVEPDETLTDRYRHLAQVNGNPAEYFSICIIGETFTIVCMAGNEQFCLTVCPQEDLVYKTVAVYRYAAPEYQYAERRLRYGLENTNNTTFTRLETKRIPLIFSQSP